MHRESLAVQHLPIHLPNEHYVNFCAHQTVNEVLARQNVEKTQLFDYNSAHNDGLGLTYWQFPQYYTWNAKVKSWHPRRRAKVIGRMYFVSPSKGEQFFLRLLLTIFEGGKSWEHLRTIIPMFGAAYILDDYLPKNRHVSGISVYVSHSGTQ